MKPRIVSATFAAVLAGAALMTLSAAGGHVAANALVAGTSGFALTAWTVFLARRVLAGAEPAGRRILVVAGDVAGVTGFGYLWASLSMAGMYYLTDLSWYHAYEYAIYFALPAVLAGLVARRLGSGRVGVAGGEMELNWLRRLTVVQAVVAVLGAVYLLASGKLANPFARADAAGLIGLRPDWAANHVFFAGASMLFAISVLALMVLGRLRKGPVTARRERAPIGGSRPPG